MSIELQEARKKLDIFEKGANNPEIFMSASFAELYCLFVSKRYLKKILDREHTIINEKNELLKKKYDKDIRKQNLYLKKAPDQILKIEQKQKEIVSYLSGYGFTQYNDVD